MVDNEAVSKQESGPHSQSRGGPERAAQRSLLVSLLTGGDGLPSARDRWIQLLTDASPEIRLRAETALLQALRELDAPPVAAAPAAPAPRRAEPIRTVDLPQYLPYKDPSEPWRHCRKCFGHDFWLNRAGEAHCKKCAPPLPEEPLEPWRLCRGCYGSTFWFDRAGSPICLRCSPPAPPGTAM